MASITTPRAGGLLLLCVLGASAAAQTGTATPTAASATRAGFTQPLTAARLEQYRGGTQIVQNDLTLNGTTANNLAQDVSTGSNAISAGSFANMSGIPVVIQNTGANVLIQNALILHLQLD